MAWPVPRVSFVKRRLFTVSPRPLQVHKEGRKARAVLRPELSGEKVNSRLVRKSVLHPGGSTDKWGCQARLLCTVESSQCISEGCQCYLDKGVEQVTGVRYGWESTDYVSVSSSGILGKAGQRARDQEETMCIVDPR